MLTGERQNKIYSILKMEGAVTVSRLISDFGVSGETVRRDLILMERAGLLERVHGGAVSKSAMKPFKKLCERNEENADKKRELSLAAADFIKDGDVIGIDSGSTAIFFAKALLERFSSLTVITHSMDVFEILRSKAGFEVILCGGHFLSQENAFYGSLTQNMLKNLHIQKMFVFPTAVSIKYGIFDYQKELFQIQRAYLDISDEIYILSDSSKFEKTGLLKMDDMRQEYTYITDLGLDSELLRLYRENEIKIYQGGGSNEK